MKEQLVTDQQLGWPDHDVQDTDCDDNPELLAGDPVPDGWGDTTPGEPVYTEPEES
jgi:hypothetical protein